MPVIYIDVLFFVNVFVNTFLILEVAMVLHLPVKPLRIGAGASVGALYSCISFLNSFGIGENFVLRMICAFGIILISFGACRPLAAVKRALCFTATTVVTGVSLLALLYFTDIGIKLGGVIKNGVFYFDIPTTWLVLCVASSFCIMCILKKLTEKKISRNLCIIKLLRLGKTVEITALIDTGNMLRDPLTGKKVIIAEADTLSPLFNFDLTGINKSENLPEGFRLIPYSSIGMENGLLAAFVPDSTYVNKNLKRDFVTAVFDGKLSPGGDYQALIGPNI